MISVSNKGLGAIFSWAKTTKAAMAAFVAATNNAGQTAIA
jgi:hypothetical protein